jgi:hypothetical protein
MAGRQRRELFHASVVEGTGSDQDRTNMLLRHSCEGWFEIPIGSGIHHNELPAERARRRLLVREDGFGSYRDWVCEKAEPASIR